MDRFLRYVSVDTQSNEESETQPSAEKEHNLLRMLLGELKEMGVDASLDEYGYVMGTIPSNISKKVPAVGFISHVDTSPDAPGKDVKPQIVKDYDGSDIALKGVPGLFLKPAEFPELLHYIGKTLITTDGTTKFDVKKFGADFAYTMDGDEVGGLEYENFNAASAHVHIQGRNVHPGSAKGKMKNSILIGMELNSLLPIEQRPEYTEGYDGFFHLMAYSGTVEETNFSYIIRDHDAAKFEEKKKMLADCAAFINRKYGEGTATAVIKDQYRNMKEQILPHMEVVDIAKKAMLDAGITPRVKPIRGGTDGANLSYMGLPCPNLFAGGLNFHGRLEYVPLESMEKASEVIVNIIKLYAEE